MSKRAAGEEESVRVEWAQQDADPDLTGDLDYRLDDWEVVDARSAGNEQLMFLPNDEDLIKEEAFIVAEPDAVRNLGDSV
ncbi:hypothetical protein [Halostella salina]|uniref:hypothetical protein n=1 Tax=Halostella salina TaxID=1547897 RepID=UPI000EF7FDD8|nr:hypothetical protein [Halostella salina]